MKNKACEVKSGIKEHKRSGSKESGIAYMKRDRNKDTGFRVVLKVRDESFCHSHSISTPNVTMADRSLRRI
jgi:hypothetical protein